MTMSNRDFASILAEADKVTPTGITAKGGNSAARGVPSISIVNSRKVARISFNALLLNKLKIENSIDVVPIESQRVILISKKLPQKAAITCSLHQQAKSKSKVSYWKELVELLTNEMNINYDNGITSRSFSNIQFNDINGVPAAVVIIDDKSAGTEPSDSEGEEAASA